jgi:hypothetical protein
VREFPFLVKIHGLNGSTKVTPALQIVHKPTANIPAISQYRQQIQLSNVQQQ